MSPLPSPTPLRSLLLKVVFSPAGLLCGFVVLLIATCPGARGEEAISMLLANGGLSAAARPASLDSFVVTPLAPARTEIGRSVSTAPRSLARSKTPAERSAESARPTSAGGMDVPSPARSALPLVADPLAGAADRPTSAALVPMTGPAVGIRPRLPGSTR